MTINQELLDALFRAPNARIRHEVLREILLTLEADIAELAASGNDPLSPDTIVTAMLFGK